MGCCRKTYFVTWPWVHTIKYPGAFASVLICLCYYVFQNSFHTFFKSKWEVSTFGCGTFFGDCVARVSREGQAWENILSQHLTLLPLLTPACLHRRNFEHCRMLHVVSGCPHLNWKTCNTPILWCNEAYQVLTRSILLNGAVDLWCLPKDTLLSTWASTSYSWEYNLHEVTTANNLQIYPAFISEEKVEVCW